MTSKTNRRDELREQLMLQAAAIAGISREDFSGNDSLDTLGLDSSDAVILAMQIEEVVGGEVDVGIFLRVETVGEAIDEIVRLHLEQGPVPRRA